MGKGERLALTNKIIT